MTNNLDKKCCDVCNGYNTYGIDVCGNSDCSCHKGKKPCCPKCIIDLDYKPAQCSDGECECHQAPIPGKYCEHGIEMRYACPLCRREGREYGKSAPIPENYERDYSHTHCWKQEGSPACGIPLEKHTQCCLCDTPIPVEGWSIEKKLDEGYELRHAKKGPSTDRSGWYLIKLNGDVVEDIFFIDDFISQARAEERSLVIEGVREMVKTLRVEKPHRKGEEAVYEIKKMVVEEIKVTILSLLTNKLEK